jgi:hypothetical protein
MASRSTIDARLIKPDKVDFGSLAPELQHHGIDRSDPGQVPDMRPADVDRDPIERLPEIESRDKVAAEAKLPGEEEPESSTPTSTPIARLCVSDTTTTVASMTTLELRGCTRRLRIEPS